ncbi:MAG: hypothetical protein VX000_11750, partial [Myxococcota bacterium]|nr:hypothetical protein [Myxococcota bacterium]
MLRNGGTGAWKPGLVDVAASTGPWTPAMEAAQARPDRWIDGKSPSGWLIPLQCRRYAALLLSRSPSMPRRVLPPLAAAAMLAVCGTTWKVEDI